QLVTQNDPRPIKRAPFPPSDAAFSPSLPHRFMIRVDCVPRLAMSYPYNQFQGATPDNYSTPSTPRDVFPQWDTIEQQDILQHQQHQQQQQSQQDQQLSQQTE